MWLLVGLLWLWLLLWLLLKRRERECNVFVKTLSLSKQVLAYITAVCFFFIFIFEISGRHHQHHQLNTGPLRPFLLSLLFSRLPPLERALRPPFLGATI